MTSKIAQEIHSETTVVGIEVSKKNRVVVIVAEFEYDPNTDEEENLTNLECFNDTVNDAVTYLTNSGRVVYAKEFTPYRVIQASEKDLLT